MRLESKLSSIKEYQARYPWMILVVVVAFSSLVFRLAQLQIAEGEKYLEMSEQNFVQEQLVPPLRGRIMDREGRPLADNRPAYSIFVTPAFLGNAEATLVKVGGFLNLGDEEAATIRRAVLQARGMLRFREILVKNDIPRDQLALLEAHKLDLPGVSMRPAPRRYFPYDQLFAHVLGYVSPITERELKDGASYPTSASTGKSGVEREYERLLRGQFGLRKVVVDAQGRVKDQKQAAWLIKDAAFTPPQPGFDLTLTLDLDLQKAAQTAFGDRTGSVVAMDVDTGAILVWLSQPGFDPNKFVAGISYTEWERLRNSILDPLMDKVAQAAYYPGSTYKIVGALAGLERKVVTPSSRVGCSGAYSLGNHVFHCWKRPGHGSMDVYHALKESCDVYFYTVGERLGYEKLREVSAELGFGEKPGIGINNETAGVLPTPEWHKQTHGRSWYTGDTISHVIGQGDLKVSPLQLALAYAAIANGGRVLVPKLLKTVSDIDGRLLEVMQTEVKRHLTIDSEHLLLVREALAKVVNEQGGTAYSSRLLEPIFAGKTGSAQVAGLPPDKRAHDDYLRKDHAWFVGFAPVDSPRIVVVAMAEHGEHGAWIAPIVRDVIAAWYEKNAGRPAKRLPGQVPLGAAVDNQIGNSSTTPVAGD